MKKIIAVIPITILFILLSFNYNVYADSDHYCIVVTKFIDNNYEFKVYNCSSSAVLDNYNSTQFILRGCSLYADNNFTFYPDPDSAVNRAYQYVNSLPTLSSGSNSYINKSAVYIITNGITNNVDGEGVFDSYQEYEDYINPPPTPTTWYDEMFDEFIGAVEGIASVVTGGFTNLVEAFTEFWVVPVGGDEGDMFFPTDVPLASPTPTPTPIQYQTVIAPTTDPQGNVYYEYKYIYNNPSGTPVITDSPPVNNNGGGDSFDYPYYENPDNQNNPYKLKIPWFLKLIFGNKIVDETTLDDSVNVIQDYMNDDDVNDGVTTVYDGMSAIPTDWLILIGVIASIPLFGCLISRLLS